MDADIILEPSQNMIEARPYTLREIIFSQLSHRKEDSIVILGHQEEKLIEISLHKLRILISELNVIISAKNLVKGDTVMLASYYASNELPNAILFAALACLGIRVFIPIYPEANEFDSWLDQTKFKAVVIPYIEILKKSGHESEKESIFSLQSLCGKYDIPFWDANDDFSISALLRDIEETNSTALTESIFTDHLTPETEAVIFTTSGTSGKTKLLVYNQGAFSISCQSWQQAGLFTAELFGNRGFTPLFTHTIGIRSFINAVWSGNPVCIMTVGWFIHKPALARYLLLQMHPQHIIGGPALFNMLLEFLRQFPELKETLRKDLKSLISIGAPYNPDIARQIKSGLGLDLFNGFGTTETQMVLLNKFEKNGTESLGKPLPGVSIALRKTEREGIYELFLNSAYEACYTIGEEKSRGPYASGDLVIYDEDGSLKFLSRKADDFIKDGFGVKIPINALGEYYPMLFKICIHIEWIPLDNSPGLAALVFLDPSWHHYSAKEVIKWIKHRNEILRSSLQPFEFSHRHLERVSLVRAEVPFTRKGSFSRKDISKLYGDLVAKLMNPYITDARIESVDAEERPLLHEFSNPRLASFLEAIGMDVYFEKGERDTLFYKSKGQEKTVLDLVGGFGANLCGHAHPEIKEAIKRFLDSNHPALNSQGSLYHYPALLARELNRLFNRQTGKYFKVQFGNSGTEAVEIALHHAYFEWRAKLEKIKDEQLQRYGKLEEFDVIALWDQNMKIAAEATAAIIVINNCFHGYSAGARSLLNSKKQRSHFSGLLRIAPLHINDKTENWDEEVEKFKKEQCLQFGIVEKEEGSFVVKRTPVSIIIASIIEPVRGEGGICETRSVVADYLSRQSFPLISDEIQCGLGRTGSIPSYSGASYYLLGKSLGGGYEKIAAVLIDDSRFVSSFPKYYNSTFANGEMAACAGLASLQVIMKENYPEIARAKGIGFMDRLTQVARSYPDIIESVEGKGLMLGVHFNKKFCNRNIFLRAAVESELLGYLLSGWLFKNKNIRVLPSLSKPDSMRLEPSVYITEKNMDDVCAALEELCALCRRGEVYEIFRYLMNEDPYLDQATLKISGRFPNQMEAPVPGALKVGFIGNFTMPPGEFRLIEPDLRKASDTGLRILFDKMQELLEGKCIRLFSKNLMNGKIHFSFYILPYDTAHLEMIHHFGKKREYIAKIQKAVNQLAGEGATHISLGAYASVLTGNGLYLGESGKVKILTGNTLTVASCLYHARQFLMKRRREQRDPITVAIVGASGNIGSALAGCFDDKDYHDAKLILLGNNLKKLEQVRRNLICPERSIICTTNLFMLKMADIIISCTNSNDRIIFPHHIHPEKRVFLIDIAVPESVSEEVKKLDNVIFCDEASSVYLPDDPDLVVSTHTPEGKIFCCAAEVMLAALYDIQLPLKGHIQPESIKKMMELAELEGIFNNRNYAAPV